MPARKNTPKVPITWSLERSVANAVIGLLISLIGSGVTGMVMLASHVATLTEIVTRTETQLARHLDNSVPRDQYEKRDQSVQRQLNDKASKDELAELRAEVKEELSDLKEMIHTINEGFTLSRAREPRK